MHHAKAMHMNLIDDQRLDRITDWANQLAGYSLGELRIRQTIVEDQLGRPASEAARQRMLNYREALRQAVDQIAFGT